LAEEVNCFQGWVVVNKIEKKRISLFIHFVGFVLREKKCGCCWEILLWVGWEMMEIC
jgi:hypothetical protein